MTAVHQLIDFYRLQIHLMWAWRTGRRAYFRRLLVSLATSFVSFAAMVWLSPGIRAQDWLAIAQAVVIITLVNALVRPVIVFLAGLHAPGWDVNGRWVSHVTVTNANVVLTTSPCGSTDQPG